MNVAITRAKELLIVIGNPTLLKRDPYWHSFLQFVKRHNLFVSVMFRRFFPDKIQICGTLTGARDGRKLHLAIRVSFCFESLDLLTCCSRSRFIHDAELDEEDLGVFIAGGVAREILREGP